MPNSSPPQWKFENGTRSDVKHPVRRRDLVRIDVEERQRVEDIRTTKCCRLQVWLLAALTKILALFSGEGQSHLWLQGDAGFLNCRLCGLVSSQPQLCFLLVLSGLTDCVLQVALQSASFRASVHNHRPLPSVPCEPDASLLPGDGFLHPTTVSVVTSDSSTPSVSPAVPSLPPVAGTPEPCPPWTTYVLFLLLFNASCIWWQCDFANCESSLICLWSSTVREMNLVYRIVQFSSESETLIILAKAGRKITAGAWVK